MAIELTMPALSPTMEKATLAKWLVAEGDLVKAGEPIAEIETDKATMEYEAPGDGRIVRLVIAEGSEDVAVGAVVALLAGAEEGTAEATAMESAPAPVPALAPVTAPAPDSLAPPPATTAMVCLGKTGPILERARCGERIGEGYGTSTFYAGTDHREAA